MNDDARLLEALSQALAPSPAEPSEAQYRALRRAVDRHLGAPRRRPFWGRRPLMLLAAAALGTGMTAAALRERMASPREELVVRPEPAMTPTEVVTLAASPPPAPPAPEPQAPKPEAHPATTKAVTMGGDPPYPPARPVAGVPHPPPAPAPAAVIVEIPAPPPPPVVVEIETEPAPRAPEAPNAEEKAERDAEKVQEKVQRAVEVGQRSGEHASTRWRAL